jgi:putative membrane protein
MSTLFAFLHHLCAFTLVSAVAIEFTLIRQPTRSLVWSG